MEATQVGVRTRGRGMTVVVEEAEDNSGAVKRRKVKVGDEKLTSPSSTFVLSKTLDREICVNSATEEDPSESCDESDCLRSGGVPASCCSSAGSMEQRKVADLKESFETETAARYDLDGCESTPTSELKSESGEVESSTVKQSSVMTNSGCTILSPEKMPPEAELEAFFAAAEEDLNQRFKDKYNYDIVNDIPLQGRYEWIQLTREK